MYTYRLLMDARRVFYTALRFDRTFARCTYYYYYMYMNVYNIMRTQIK